MSMFITPTITELTNTIAAVDHATNKICSDCCKFYSATIMTDSATFLVTYGVVSTICWDCRILHLIPLTGLQLVLEGNSLLESQTCSTLCLD